MYYEYDLTVNGFATDYFNAIDNFFSIVSSSTPEYVLFDSQSDRRVYRNLDAELYLIFYNVIDAHSSRIALLVSTSYYPEKEVWYQEDIICNGYDECRSDYWPSSPNYIDTASYFFPTFVTSFGQKMVCDFNEENHTFMFSVASEVKMSYDFSLHRTQFFVFGNVSKRLDFEGGFFYGGNFMVTYERFYQHNQDDEPIRDGLAVIYDPTWNDIRFHIQPPPLGHTGFWSYPFRVDPYVYKDNCCRNGNHVPDNNKTNTFDAVLRADIDNAPNRRRDEPVVEEPKFDEMPIIKRKILWAVTPEIDYYTHMVCSITRSKKLLPRYETLIGHSCIDEGHTANTLNGISLVMPLWFMVLRDPVYLQTYSGAGYNNVINFVDMFNMYTHRLEQGTYPVEGNYYDCFQMGIRRLMFGMKGYNGIAFKMEDGDVVPENLSLLDLRLMMQKRTGGAEVINIENDGVEGYGGDTQFSDMPAGSFLLKHPYTDYDSITFTFCDDEGEDVDEVTWTREQLDAALNGSEPFNLLPPDSPVTWGMYPGCWGVEPFSGGSTPTKFCCGAVEVVPDAYFGQNCGLVGIKGNK